jgi:ribosomal protein S18 acetylase RimI-like enzyme
MAGGDGASDASAPRDSGASAPPEPTRLADGALLRRAEPADGPELRRLYRAAMRAEGTDPADVPDTDDLADVGAAYVDPGGEFLVVESEGHIVAMGGLAVDGEDLADGEGELFRIGVDTDHQRRGYGSAILAGLEDAARERGLDRIVLTTARRQAAATEFYPAHGYERVGRERQGEYRLVRFAKSLE